MAQRLLGLLLVRLSDGDRVLFAVDHSPTKRYGPKVEGAGIHHNPTPGPAWPEVRVRAHLGVHCMISASVWCPELERLLETQRVGRHPAMGGRRPHLGGSVLVQNQSARLTAARRLSMTNVLGTPPNAWKALSNARTKFSVDCRSTTTLYAFRLWLSTTRST